MKKLTFLSLALFVIMSSVQCVTLYAADVRIDASKQSEPISKYVYGQFIEHLGRCIYGGIWAEMLEDRKFYFPVTDEYKPWRTFTERGYWRGGDFPGLGASPWRVIGPENTVKMTTDDPFVGEQTPEITLPGDGSQAGIEHGGLGIVRGKKYTGYVYIQGDATVAPIYVCLVSEEGKKADDFVVINEVRSDYSKYSFELTAKADTHDAWLQIVGSGSGSFKIGTASIMPKDNIHGFRPETVELMKELDSPVYRWPGGNFVSDYDWKDGVGDRDRRPPRKNPAWTGIESNDVGIHEFMVLCGLLDTEPFIAVNTGLGTVEMAAEEVEYCNGSIDTRMGKWRAQNGHPEPFNVKWWAVGNEMYGNWQLGHMPLSDYVKKHKACVDAIWEVDPNAKLIAVGAIGEWSQTMMRETSDHMNLISEHIYKRDLEDVTAHVKQLVDGIREISDAHRKYRDEISGLTAKDIRIALDEWNYWYGQYRFGELGVRYHLKDALGIAAGLHEMYRNSDMFFMANYAQTVNVIGAIKTSKTEAEMETTGLALKMYRQHYGELPVAVSGSNGPLDVAAALSADKKTLTVGVVNTTNEAVPLDINFSGATVSGKYQQWTIAGDDPLLYNEPGAEPQVEIASKKSSIKNNRLEIAPLSASVYAFTVE